MSDYCCIMQDTALDKIKIVLTGTTHPGNIGAAARAMKTMGLTRLALVSPKTFPCAEASARAAGADDVLARAVVYDSLQDAVSECVMVYGTSARTRNLSCPLLAPEQAARQLLERAQQSADVAIVFGRERTGLTNDELDICHKMIVIPANPDFASLNLAAAVQIMCYELCKSVYVGAGTGKNIPNLTGTVSVEELDHLYAHLREVMIQIKFLDPQKPRRLMRRLKLLFNRAGLDENEYNILRGILTAVQESLRKK